MNESDTQAVNFMMQFINKCSGPTGGEFVTFQQCILQLKMTIQKQGDELAALTHTAADTAAETAADTP